MQLIILLKALSCTLCIPVDLLSSHEYVSSRDGKRLICIILAYLITFEMY